MLRIYFVKYLCCPPPSSGELVHNTDRCIYVRFTISFEINLFRENLKQNYNRIQLKQIYLLYLLCASHAALVHFCSDSPVRAISVNKSVLKPAAFEARKWSVIVKKSQIYFNSQSFPNAICYLTWFIVLRKMSECKLLSSWHSQTSHPTRWIILTSYSVSISACVWPSRFLSLPLCGAILRESWEMPASKNDSVRILWADVK